MLMNATRIATLNATDDGLLIIILLYSKISLNPHLDV